MLEPLIDSFRTASILVILMYMFIFYVYKERKVRIDVIFMRHFNLCGFRVNTSIMFKKIITLSKFCLQIWSRNIYDKGSREIQ